MGTRDVEQRGEQFDLNGTMLNQALANDLYAHKRLSEVRVLCQEEAFVYEDSMLDSKGKLKQGTWRTERTFWRNIMEQDVCKQLWVIWLA